MINPFDVHILIIFIHSIFEQNFKKPFDGKNIKHIQKKENNADEKKQLFWQFRGLNFMEDYTAHDQYKDKISYFSVKVYFVESIWQGIFCRLLLPL